MAEPQATEYITLHEALAIAGPEVMWGWTGEEMDTQLARPNPSEERALAQGRWQEVVKWFRDELFAGEIKFYVRAHNGMTRVPMERFQPFGMGPFFLMGRLTRLSLDEAIAHQLAKEQSNEPLLFVEAGEMRDRIKHHLRPDTREFWTFIEALAWIIWQRYDAVRDYQIDGQHYQWLVEDISHLSDGDLVRRRALHDLWEKLSDGKLIGLACPLMGDGKRIPVPAIEWQDYTLTTTTIGKDMLDVLATRHVNAEPIYHSPTVKRIDLLKHWPDTVGPKVDASAVMGVSVDSPEMSTEKKGRRSPVQDAVDVAILKEWPDGVILDPRPSEVAKKIKKHRPEDGAWPRSDEALHTRVKRSHVLKGPGK